MNSFIENQHLLIEFLFARLPWVLIIVWLIYSIIVLMNRQIRNKISNYFIIDSIPNVFVTLGLFGTFTGIAYGLLYFNTSPEEIKSSITVLLEGLKHAMFTSITGIFLSLIFSKIIKVANHSKRLEPPISYELMELKKINQNIINLKNDLTKSFSDTLIDSLHEVLIEFNNTFKSMVKEMVESNFKELNNTINTLNAWQIQHKEEVEFLKEAYSSLVSKHQAFVDYTEDWIEKLDEITGQSSRLQEVIDEFNEAFNDEGNLARMIKEITDTASILKSTTHEYAKVITEVNSTAELLRGTGEKLENVSKDVSLISENTNIIVEKTEALQKINLNHIDDLVAQFNNNLKSTFETFDSLIHEYIQNIENRLKTDVSEKNR